MIQGRGIRGWEGKRKVGRKRRVRMKFCGNFLKLLSVSRVHGVQSLMVSESH